MSDTLRLEHGIRAPGHARRWIIQQCHEWQCEELADTAAVLVSELVTNVFLHARTACLIRAGFDPPILTVTVSDEDEAEFSLPPPSDTAEGGRGLAIVAALADTWGIRHSDSAKSVWFHLTTQARGRGVDEVHQQRPRTPSTPAKQPADISDITSETRASTRPHD